ncbi:MAG TPA: hypothetical protein VIY48_21845 [Candidatus Paceibacterota bacterium]
MADQLTAELLPDKSGANYTAQFTGNANSQALERASQITIYYATAAVAIEIAADEEGTTWVASGLTTTANVTLIANPPACRAIRLAGVAAAPTPPARILVRHGM